MEYTIREYNHYKEQEILNLYGKVGWTNYTDQPKMLKNAYAHSLCILGAYAGEELVGIIRAVGDGFSIIFVQDLLVLPAYQRKGIGRALLKTIMEKYKEVYQLELMTDNTPKTVAFYKSAGLTDAADAGCLAFLRDCV